MKLSVQMTFTRLKCFSVAVFFELSSVHCFTAMQERLLDPQLKRQKEGQIVLVHVSLKSVTVKHQCIFESTISKLCGRRAPEFPCQKLETESSPRAFEPLQFFRICEH